MDCNSIGERSWAMSSYVETKLIEQKNVEEKTAQTS